MRRDQPCKTCPYRVDTPLGTWHASEFEKLQVAEANPVAGRMFHCHQDIRRAPARRGFCIGWLLDQKRRGTPSIQLRLHLMQHPEAGEQFMALSEEGLELYPSIQAMCEANRLARSLMARVPRRRRDGSSRRKA